jgi:hypothetical protein
MLGKLTSILQHAAEVTTQVLAPQVPRAEEFLSHVKAITELFVDNLSDKNASDAHVDDTSIPTHLDHVLHLLCEEDKEIKDSMGPCMEMFLDRKIMGSLQNMAEVDMPMGVRTRVIQFTSSLVSQVQQPVLAQVSVHEPIQRLVSFSGNSPRTALAEYQLLNTLVLKFKRDPLNAEFFLVRKDKNQVFIVMEALVKLAHSKDSLVSIKALECIELCCSLQDPAVAKAVAKHSQLLDFITNRLQLHYKVIPTGVTPRNVLQCHASWGIDYPVHLFDSKSPPESHYLPGMFSWMDYCNILATKAHPVLGEELCTSIERQFLSTCVMADLVDS